MELFFSEHRKHQGFPKKKYEASMEDLEEDGDAVVFFGSPPFPPKQFKTTYTNLNKSEQSDKVNDFAISVGVSRYVQYHMGLAESLRLSLA